MAYVLDPHYSDQAGVDLRSNGVTRSENMAQRMVNSVYTNSGELEKRRGSKVVGTSAPAYGSFPYQKKDPDTGEILTELIGVGSDGTLKKRATTAFTLTYSGLGPTATASLYFNEVDEVFCFRLTESGVEKLDYVLQIGFDDAVPVTLSQLASQVNAIPGFSVSISGDSSLSAALLELAQDYDLKASTLTLNAYSWAQVPSPVTAPFFTVVAEKDNPDFENCSFVNANQSAYITDGGFPHKYDGVACYRAGLPAVNAQVGIAGTTGGSVPTSSTFKYRFEWEYLDANGVLHRSPITLDSGVSITTSGTQNAVNITLLNLGPASGFPAFGGYVNGAGQTATTAGVFTINVDNASGGAHNIPVGSWVLVNNGTQKYKVTATTSSTVTINHPGTTDFTSLPLTLTDNAVIYASLGEPVFGLFGGLGDFIADTLTLAIYRTRAGGSTFFESEKVRHRPFAATQVWTDTRNDLGLTREYLPQTFAFDPPRACKYLASWGTQLLQAGRPYVSTIATLKATQIPNTGNKYTEVNFCAENQVYWTDVESPEGFPVDGLHEESVDTPKGDRISGLAQNKDSFFVFKDRSIALFSGDLADNNVRREILEVDRGCASHNSIKQVDGKLVFLDRYYGFQSLVAGQLPQSIGIAINPLVKDNPSKGSLKLNLKRAVAGVHDLDDQYICYIPCEALNGPTRTANENSVIAVLDFQENNLGSPRNAWYLWTGLNMQGGVHFLDDELFFIERAWSSFSNSLRSNLFKQSRLNHDCDYEDHTQAIQSDYITSWLKNGQPSLDHSFQEINIKSLSDDSFKLTVKQYANYILDSEIMSTEVSFDKPSMTVRRNQRVSLNNARVESACIQFVNGEHKQNINITGFDIEMEPDNGGEFTR